MAREWRWTPGQTVLPGSSVPAAAGAPASGTQVPATQSSSTAPNAAAAGAAAYGVAPPSVPMAPPATTATTALTVPIVTVPLTPLRHVAPLEPPLAGEGQTAEAADGVPAPRAPLPSAVPGSSLARWISYFDAVEQAAIAVADQIDRGNSPSWPDLVVPAPTLPASMVARRDEVLALVEDVTTRAERRRDVIASELSALAPPAARGALPAGLGATLDVVG